MHIEKRNDGAYQAFFITEDGVRPVKLTEEQVKAALAKMTDTENRAEENKSSDGEGEVAKEEKQPETKENEGESGTKLSLGSDSKIATVEIKTDPQLEKLIAESDGSKYDVIREYLIANFYGQTFTMSDGKEAIMDKRDAKHLAHLADAKKTAELSNLREIIEKAVLTDNELPVDHKKFSTFSYYSVNVTFDNTTFGIQINVGKSKTDGDYHIYDLTPDKNRRAAHEASPHVARVTGTGALKNSSSEDSISHSPEKSNTSEENSPKSSLGPDSVPVEERGTPKKAEEYVETEFKATPEEVKAAMKAVKQFKLLDAETREAIINMMRSAAGIDKVTVQSIAAFMAVRSGLHVRFMKDHRAEGSHDILKKSGRRLILLDPSKMNGKHWRADIFFHELYHDMAVTGDLKGLTKTIYDTAAPAFQHAVADLYTAYYNKGVSISQFLDGKKWTEANVEAYFKEHDGVSFDDVMEEVAAGTMGRVMGSKKFIRSLRQVGALKRVFYGITNIVQAIANRAITVGGDNTAGFTLTFRDALAYKALYSRALIEAETHPSHEAIAKLKKVIEDSAERDEDVARTKMSLGGEQNQYTYNSLTSKDDLTIIDFPNSIPKTKEGKIDKKAVITEARKNAQKQNNPKNTATSTYVHVDDLGLDVLLSRDGIEHGIARSEETALAAMKIGDVVSQSVAVNELNGSAQRKTDMAYVLLGACRDNNNLYVVRTIVSKMQNNVTNIDIFQLNAIKGKKIESPTSAQGGVAVRKLNSLISSGSHVLSIADLLDFVKDIPLANEVFSKDVAKKLGVTRTTGTLSPDTRYSLSFDSTENQLTEEQDAYFKDSKVRDAQGRLQVMYQGAAEEFYTFDKKKSKPSNLYGRGFYFTNSADQARHYGTVRPYYLNITNPLATQEKTISRLQMRKFLKAVSENEDYSIENYGTYDIEKILQIVYEGKSDFAMIYDVSLTAIGDLVEATELFNEINGTAYDGFILDTEAVTFKSEQAKLTANIAPTSNPDTRYSLSLDGVAVTKEEVQRAVDAAKWNFEWTDEKLLDNINAVRRYLGQRYPDAAPSIQIDNENKRVIITDVSRFIDFDKMATYDAAFADFLRSIGVQEEDIEPHLTAFTPSQKANAVDTVNAKNESEKETPPRPRAYYKNQVKMATEEPPNKIYKSLSYLSKRPCKTGITVLY